MSIVVWWPKLQPATRDWLIANNGDAVPAAIVEEITQAGGPLRSDAWWAGEDGSTGSFMPDAATDWIEEIANGETPNPHPDTARHTVTTTTPTGHTSTSTAPPLASKSASWARVSPGRTRCPRGRSSR